MSHTFGGLTGMHVAGVAWTARGYEIEVHDPAGAAVEAVTFPGAGIDDIAGHLTAVAARLGGPMAVVIDSTNGLLDGRLAAAGLDLYRADPWHLPERPLLGSAPAGTLAEAGRTGLAGMARLDLTTGALGGREDQLIEGIDASDAAEETMAPGGRPVYRGSRDHPQIALTFDDGPNPPFTDRILAILARYGIPATFFCVGLSASGRPGDVARLLDAGHTVGNHTWSHPYLLDLSRAELAEQIGRTADVLAAAGSKTPTMFRPPYGSRTPDVLSWLPEMSSGTILWDVDSGDWAMPAAAVISATVLEAARPGSIVLMHDGGGDRSQTVAALPAVIEGLLARDYRFVTVDRLAPAH